MESKIVPTNPPAADKNSPGGVPLPTTSLEPATSMDSLRTSALPGEFRPAEPETMAVAANTSAAQSLRAVDNSRETQATVRQTQHPDSKESEHESFLATTRRTVKACKDSILSTFFYSTTGVLAQGASIGVPHPSLMPNPFAYGMIRSFFAGLTTFSRARNGLSKLGKEELGMAALVGTSNTLWIPAFMFTDLASATVIAFSSPLMHAAYEGLTKKKIPSLITTISLGATATALYTIYQGGQHAGKLPMLGNACALAATLCLATYRVLVGKAAQKARESSDPTVQQATKEKLDAVSFVSNVVSFGMGAAALPITSGGLGINSIKTLALGAVHGVFGGAAIHYNTRANQQLSQVTTSLIGSVQVGVTPALGYLLWGSAIPEYALFAGVLTFAASGLAIVDKWRQERRHTRITPEIK